MVPSYTLDVMETLEGSDDRSTVPPCAVPNGVELGRCFVELQKRTMQSLCMFAEMWFGKDMMSKILMYLSISRPGVSVDDELRLILDDIQLDQYEAHRPKCTPEKVDEYKALMLELMQLTQKVDKIKHKLAHLAREACLEPPGPQLERWELLDKQKDLRRGPQCWLEKDLWRNIHFRMFKDALTQDGFLKPVDGSDSWNHVGKWDSNAVRVKCKNVDHTNTDFECACHVCACHVCACGCDWCDRERDADDIQGYPHSPDIPICQHHGKHSAHLDKWIKEDRGWCRCKGCENLTALHA